MPSRRLDASEGGADRGREAEKRLREAMLAACGELGYSRVTVPDVVARASVSEERFEASFASLRECFERAYEEESGLLCDRILQAGARPAGWREGFHCALTELADYLQQKPLAAKALLVDVHVAGGNAFTCRLERFERLSHALDSARRETRSRHSSPPLTAFFMVSTIEAAVVSALLRQTPEEFLKVIPELETLVSLAYFAD